MRHFSQDISHEVNLATLPGRAQPFLADRGLDPGVGIRDAQRRPFHAPGLYLPEEHPPGVLRFVVERLYDQDLPGSRGVDPAGDHHRHGDDSAFNPDLLVQGVDPQERVRRVKFIVVIVVKVRVGVCEYGIYPERKRLQFDETRRGKGNERRSA